MLQVAVFRQLLQVAVFRQPGARLQHLFQTRTPHAEDKARIQMVQNATCSATLDTVGPATQIILPSTATITGNGVLFHTLAVSLIDNIRQPLY